MATLTLNDEQGIDLVRQFPPDRKRELFLTLSEPARLAYAESQLRRLSAERGMEWEAMGEVECEAFVDDLVHVRSHAAFLTENGTLGWCLRRPTSHSGSIGPDCARHPRNCCHRLLHFVGRR